MTLQVGNFRERAALLGALNDSPPETSLVAAPRARTSCFSCSQSPESAGRGHVKGILKDAVAEHLHIPHADRAVHDAMLDRVVNQLLLRNEPLGSVTLTAAVARAALGNVDTALEAWGEAPRIYPNMEFQQGEDVRNVLRYLLGNPQLRERGFPVLTPEIFQAGVLRRDQAFLTDALRELQAVSTRLFTHLLNEGLPPENRRLTEILLGQVIGLIPFFEPPQGSPLQLPQKINGAWRMVTFRVDRLPLTPRWLGPPMLAYGLTPSRKSIAGARPMLLYTGTAHPTSSGWPLDSWTDFVPGYSVGEFVFNWWAKDPVIAWMERAKQATNQNVDVTGVSLGGSLTLLTTAHRPDLVANARAFVPAALREALIADYRHKCEQCGHAPHVDLYWQERDVVSLVGAAWASEWHLFRLIPLRELNPLESHIKALSAQEYVVSVRMNTQRDSDSLVRTLSNIAYQILCIPIFGILSILVLVRAAFYTIKSRFNSGVVNY